MFFLPLLAGIPSFREEVCLASSQQRSFQRDGWTSLEFTWFFSMAISTTQCCQSPTVKTPRMDESAKITDDKIRRASHQVFSYMDDIYIYIHPEEMFILCNPSPVCGLLLQLGVSLDDLFHPIFSHLTPGRPLPTRNKGDTIRRMMRHLR